MKRIKVFDIPEGYCRLFVFQQDFLGGFFQCVLLFDKKGMCDGQRVSGNLTVDERALAQSRCLDWIAVSVSSVRQELGV